MMLESTITSITTTTTSIVTPITSSVAAPKPRSATPTHRRRPPTHPKSQAEFSANQFQIQHHLRSRQQPQQLSADRTKRDYFFSQPYYPYYYRQYYLNNFGIGVSGKYRLAAGRYSITPPLKHHQQFHHPNHHSAIISVQKHRKKQKQKNKNKSSSSPVTSKKHKSSSMTTMIMNGAPPLFNGTKFMIKFPNMAGNGQTLLNINGTKNAELNQNTNVENDKQNHHDHHLQESPSFLNSDEEEIQYQKQVVDTSDHEIMDQKYLSNGYSNNDLMLNHNDLNTNASQITMSSCAISISSHNNHHSHHNTNGHDFHSLFGTSTTTLSTSKKSLKMILCSWVLTILVLLIIIGISFACGLLAAQYIYQSFCDVSSTSSELNLVSSNRSPLTRNQRIGHFSKLGGTSKINLNNTILMINNRTDINMSKKHDLDEINSTVVFYPDINASSIIAPTVVYSSDLKDIEIAKDPFNNDVIKEVTSHNSDAITTPSKNFIKNFSTSLTATNKTSNRSPNFITLTDTTIKTVIDLIETPTTTELPEKQDEISSIMPIPNLSLFSSTTSSPSIHINHRQTSVSKITTESNILSTLIDQYNQALNETVIQANLEADNILLPIFNLSSTIESNNLSFLNILDSNQTKIKDNQSTHDTTTITMPPTPSENSYTTTIKSTLIKSDKGIENLSNTSKNLMLPLNFKNDDESITNARNVTKSTVEYDHYKQGASTELNNSTKDELLNNKNIEHYLDRSSNNNQTATTIESLVELIANSVDVNYMTDLNSISYDSSWLNQNERSNSSNENFNFQSNFPSTISNSNNEAIIAKNLRDMTGSSNLKILSSQESNRTGRIFGPEDSNEEEYDLIDLNNKQNYNNTTKTFDDKNLNASWNVTNLPIVKMAPTPLCLDTQFQCPNSTLLECLDKSRICDGIIDCPIDKFDEQDCWDKNCGYNFRCGRLSQTSATFIEQSTPVVSFSNTIDVNSNSSTSILNQQTNSITNPVTMPTKVAECIPRSHYCDGIWDCSDGSDEIECHIAKCEAGKVLCRDNSACITGKQACDGIYNCLDRSDEAGCGTKSSCESMGKFYCDDSALCISKSLVCDGIPDCLNGTDENDCMTPETCKAADSKFFCQQSFECIDESKRCDGQPDCIDYSDEDRCFESDLENYVYAFNGAKHHWSLLCVNEGFDKSDADQICSMMGMAYSKEFSTIRISRLLNDSTWAILNPPIYQSSILNNSTIVNTLKSTKSHLSLSYSLSFQPTCEYNLALMVECEQLYCDARNHDLSTPNIAFETPEEVPIPILITNSNKIEIFDNGSNHNFSNKCLAYSLSPKWLITSGQCLMSLKYNDNDKNLTINVGDKTYLVKHVRIHPKYSIFRTIRFPDYDMALVETEESLPESSLNHSTICLPNSKLDPEITCFIGSYRNGDTAFKVLESSYCNSTNHFASSLTDRHVCASNSQEDGSKTSVCLPPYLPLICLSSQRHWYIAGYTSYQRGCDPLTGVPIFMGYFPHPTLFSNLFSMKQFISQTLGTGSYRRKRFKIGEFKSNDDQQSDQLLSVDERRAIFVVAGSKEDQKLIEQDSRKQKSYGVTKLKDSDTESSDRNGTTTMTKILMLNSTIDLPIIPFSNSSNSNNSDEPITFATILETNSSASLISSSSATDISSAFDSGDTNLFDDNNSTEDPRSFIKDVDMELASKTMNNNSTIIFNEDLDDLSVIPTVNNATTSKTINILTTSSTSNDTELSVLDISELSLLNDTSEVNQKSTVFNQTTDMNDRYSSSSSPTSIIAITTVTTTATIDESLIDNKSSESNLIFRMEDDTNYDDSTLDDRLLDYGSNQTFEQV